MNYLQFHFIFVFPLLLLLYFASKPQKRDLIILCLIAFAALIYTTPWDNFLIKEKVWTYSQESVIGTIFYAPIEEYMFMILQPLLTGLWVLKASQAFPQNNHSKVNVVLRVIVSVLWIILSVWGYFCLNSAKTYYLGLILVWACPIVAIQWAYGAGKILKSPQIFWLGWALPSLYLCVADRIAIGYKIWTISDSFRTGIEIIGLPIEEVCFFTITNLLVVQGFLLFKNSDFLLLNKNK